MSEDSNRRERIPRWLKAVCGFAALLAGLSYLESLKNYPLRQYISELIPHIIWVASAGILGAILIWIAEELVERNIVPLIRDGFEGLKENLRTAIKTPVDGITETLRDGFSRIASTVAEEVHRFPQTWDQLFRGKLIAQVTDPQARELAKEGRIGDAITSLDETVKDQRKIQEQVALYVLSSEEKDWSTALELIRQHEIRVPGFYVTLAFRYWSIGKLQQAIEIAKRALAIALEAGDEEQAARAKNSLAYYLAETDDVAYENAARQYIAEAKKMRQSAAVLDTEGYVKITFGRSREEIMEGVKISERAREMGAPFEAFANHINKANQRLKKLEQENPPDKGKPLPRAQQ